MRSPHPPSREPVMQHQRKRIWIDRIQTYLITRIGLYCVLFQSAVWAVVLIDRSLNSALTGMFGDEGLTYCFAFGAFGVLLLTVAVMYDALKFAHRFVGPLYRFRKTIQAIAAGEEVELVHLRNGDYLQELKNDFNDMLVSLEQRGAITLKDSPDRKSTRLNSSH